VNFPFLVLEGCDYSGKTTLAKKLHQDFETRTGKKWLLVDSWYGAPEFKHHAVMHSMNEEERFGWAQKARVRTSDYIRTQMAAYPCYVGVISDRWYLSSVIYQGIPLKDVLEDSLIRGILFPTATYFMPIGLDELHQRILCQCRDSDDNYWRDTVSAKIATIHAKYAALRPQIANAIDDPCLLIEDLLP
jgi:thymidylate kinase